MAAPRIAVLSAHRLWALLVAVVLTAGACMTPAYAERTGSEKGDARSTLMNDCFGETPKGPDGKPVEDQSRRIAACTAIIDDPSSLDIARIQAYRQRAHSLVRKGLYDRAIEDYDVLLNRDMNAADLAMRALAYSLKGMYDRAIEDYNRAIVLAPNFAVAYNNRAWAYYRSGRGQQGMADVERSIRLDPFSEHAYDTRAHIRQVMGDTQGALADYDKSIRLGGARMIKLYQCGLAERGLYKGERDGRDNPELRQAFGKCVLDKECDPLPGDEQCRDATS